MNPAVAAALPIDGWMDEIELVWLAEHAARHNCILEFGSYKGRSTKALALATPGRVYAVDRWAGDMERDVLPQFVNNLSPEIETGKVFIRRMETGRAFHAFKAEGVAPDMVFIDADHEYQAVKEDIATALRLLNGRGLICGHDFSTDWPGVQHAVIECIDGFKRGPGILWFKEL